MSYFQFVYGDTAKGSVEVSVSASGYARSVTATWNSTSQRWESNPNAQISATYADYGTYFEMILDEPEANLEVNQTTGITKMYAAI